MVEITYNVYSERIGQAQGSRTKVVYDLPQHSPRDPTLVVHARSMANIIQKRIGIEHANRFDQDAQIHQLQTEVRIKI